MIAGSLADLGEWGLIRALASRMPQGSFASVGIGDDSAVVATPSGSVVAAVDLLLEGRHFLPSWSSGYDIGVKAAARSLADIAAMGAKPTALLVALAAPGSLPVSWAMDLASGLASEAGRAGAGIVGGDTASADSVALSVTALGDLDGVPPVRRSGARPGDVVAVAGPLGDSAAGYALRSAGISGFAALVAAHLRPAPPYDAGPEAARLGATAMIDVSDGLYADLGHVATASGVTIDVSAPSLLEAFAGPLTAAAAALASARGDGGSEQSTVLDWVLTGGEDHSLAATFPASVSLPPRWQVIGAARPRGGEVGGGEVGGGGGVRAGGGPVTVDGEPYAGPGGWQHFR